MTKRRNIRRILSRTPSRRLNHETLEKRELLAAHIGDPADSNAPQLIAVAANAGDQFDLLDNNLLSVSPTELTFRFDGGQQLDSSTFSAIQFQASGGDGSFAEGNERTIVPGFLGFQDDGGTRVVTARFAETLPDDQYLVQISGFDDTNAGIVGLRNVEGDLFFAPDPTDINRPFQEIRFEVEIGPRVVAVVPQPVEVSGALRIQRRNQVYVFFNDDPLSNPAAGPITSSSSSLSVVNPQFYKLIFTHDTVENTDDASDVFTPTSVTYDPALNRAALTFADDLSELAPALANDGAGTYRLRVGSGEALPTPPQSNVAIESGFDTFAAAAALQITIDNGSNRQVEVGAAGSSPAVFGQADGTQSVVVRGGVIRSTKDVIPQWPGAAGAAGSRNNRRDAQVVGRFDTNTGINIFEYNFANLYGVDPQGNQLDNAITPAQRQRAREVLDLYAGQLGVQFIETENRGLQIVTGDLRSLAVSSDTGGGDTPYSAYRVSDLDPTKGVLVLDAGETWYDGYGLSPNNRPSWFVEAIRGIGSLLGIGDTFELPPGVGSGGSSLDEPNSLVFSSPFPNLPIEPDFLSQSDVTVGQALHRPESDDVDFYSFSVISAGRLSAETFAQRLDGVDQDTTQLDTNLKLFRVVSAGQFELVAANDDFYSNDSFIGIDLLPGEYYIGVSSTGNDGYNGEVDGSALGGRTEGNYELRVTFEAQGGATIADTNGSELDGDADGTAGGEFNFWFRVARDTPSPAADEPRVIFVDKLGDDFLGDGTLGSPYETISRAFADARRSVVGHPGDIVRLLPNGGDDGLISTIDDNLAYEIGRGGPGNAALADGVEFEVPQGVTVMIDAGSIIKLRSAKISVGSESVDEDRSLAALQVLGTPLPTDGQGNPLLEDAGTVYFTSFDDPDIGFDNNPLPTSPATGQWAGIEFRNDFDYSEGRPVWETEGIFLDFVSHAEIQWGGGNIASNKPIVNPIQLLESRPTIINNFIHDNADAAISADPNSFLETNFQAPIFQRVAPFTSDYDRVGPEIFGNRLIDNSFNGLFIRVNTPAAGELEPMTVSGRLDDRDIVHGLSQVLVLQGQPGGPLLLEERPDVLSVTLSDIAGTLDTSLFYDYRLTFVTDAGSESLASLSTTMRLAASGGLTLNNLPAAPDEFSGRRLYRFNPATTRYEFVTQLDRGTTSYSDNGQTRGGLLPDNGTADSVLLPRFDARLSIDPGLVIKLQGARIEASFGADFYAEGKDGQEIVFTSRLDDTFGAGGTFDTNNDGGAGEAGAGAPSGGDWGGLVFRQGSTGKLDFTQISYAGGSTAIEGAFTAFNAVEVLQADVRIANSILSNNASGFISASTRGGRGFNDDATIFVRGSQPIIVNNVIEGNEGAAISINPDSLNFDDVLDSGRSTGPINIVETDQDNQGPLIAGNELDNNSINGLRVRSEILTTESVWDDTDIVHVVDGEIRSMTHHNRSGLRLKSDPNQSLVVKLDVGATLVGSGRPLDIIDRIGGTLQIIGQGGFPVILTSIRDDTVGAGFTPDGAAQTDTDNVDATPQAGDWDGIQLLSYVNDRNVGYVIESERAITAANAQNATANDAQGVGDLAAYEYGGDENVRLGFNIRGTLADPTDQDVFRFSATGGTAVFIDIDDTSFGLDTVVELIDVNDVVLASSDNSFAETTDPSLLTSTLPPGSVRPLYQLGIGNVESPNSLDAGMRVILPGSSSVADNDYFVRVRSANGSTSGQYQLSIRLRETDEIAGSTIQLADIRFATDAITVSGSPLHSPLVGDLNESLQNQVVFDPTPGSPNSGDEYTPESAGNRLNASPGNADSLGNLLTSDRGSLVVTGEIGNITSANQLIQMEDVDVYQVDLFAQQIAPDVFDSENRFVTTTFDIDYADGLGRVNTSIAVFNQAGQLILHSRDSNIADDVGRPGRGVDSENLAGGSAGVLDAYIGPVELPEGTYYVAVSSAVALPTVLDQFFEPNPTDTNVRLMPINSIRRIADEAFDDPGAFFAPADQNVPLIDASGNYTADRSIIEPLFDADSIVKFTLDDMRLFVNADLGIQGTNRSTLLSFNPFTGVLERVIGPFGPRTADLAIRDDGELYAITTGPQTGPSNSGNIGNYLNISSATAAAASGGDDAIVFQRDNQAGTDLELDPNGQLIVNAITFPLNDSAYPFFDFDGDGSDDGFSSGDGGVNNRSAVTNGERFFVVGSRDTRGRFGEVPSELTRNLLYMYTTVNGQATSRGSTNNNADRSFAGTVPYQNFQGPASDEFEFGVIDTGFINNTGADGGDITGIAYEPGFFADSSFGDFLAVTDLGGVHRVDPQVTIAADPLSNAAGYNSVIPTTFLGVAPIDPQHAAQTGQTFPRFTGMSLGPRNIEDQAFRNVLFATTDDSWLYALRIENNQIVPANVFYNGRAAIPLVSDFTTGGPSSFSQVSINPTGLAFSTLEASPWHPDADRGASPQHGTFVPEDRSRIQELGGTALYYGFEVDANPNNNTIERADNSNLGTLAPGGSQGSIISRPFSLEGYSSDDKPTLYFSYFLEVEANDDYDPILPGLSLQNDSFRVFGAGDDGSWKLLATNDSFRLLPFNDEFDYYDESQISVQELFDDSNAWRQARVDISPLAGSENVRIRFDFSTSGSMRTAFDSFELVASKGDEIGDHETFILRDQTTINPISFINNSIVFENIVGKDIVLPPGSAIGDGEQFTLTGPEGDFTATFVLAGSATGAPGEVVYSATDTIDQITSAVFAVLPNSLSPQNEGGGRISVLAASDVTIGDATVAQSNPVQVDLTVTQLVVPDGSDIVDFEQITFDGPTTSTTVEFVQTPGSGTPGLVEIVYSLGNSAAAIAGRIVRALPVELDAVSEGDGTISFLTQPLITVGGLTSANAVNRPFAISENRFAVTVPTGDDLVNNETLTFTTPTGDTVITFVDSALPAGAGTVNFQAGESSLVLSERLVRALPLELSAFIDAVSGDVLVHAIGIAGSVQGTLINAHPIAGLQITVPDGLGFVDGEILTINGPGSPSITFVESAVPGPPGTVSFQTTDTATDIAGRILAALPPGTDAFLAGDLLTIYGFSNASSDNALTGLVVAANATQEIVLPAGVDLVSGEILTLTVSGVDTVVTFNASAGAPGPLTVNFQASDSAAVVAAKLLAALPASLNAGVSASASDVVRLSADNAVAGSTNSLITFAPTVYANLSTLNLVIADGSQLVDGESVSVFAAGLFEQFTFIEVGSGTAPSPGSFPVFFDNSNTAADLLPVILQGLSIEMQGYADINGNGLIFSAAPFFPGFDPTAFLQSSSSSFLVQTGVINESSVPVSLPDGSRITEFESITVLAKTDPFATNQRTFTFVTSANQTGAASEVVYDVTDTSEQIALKLLAVLPLSLKAYQVGTHEVHLINALAVTTESNSAIVGFATDVFNAIPVQVNSAMDTPEVAESLRISLAAGLGRLASLDGSNSASSDNFKVYGNDRIRVFNATLVNAGPYGSSYNPSADSPLPADEFGETRSPFVAAGTALRQQGALNNQVEGVLIDDIIIGFAERGEMVLNAPANQFGFVFNPETLPDSHPAAVQPERQNETLVGGYSLEIRTSDEYGVPEDFDPINIGLLEIFSQGRSFDTNDRLSDNAVTLFAQPGQSLIDGDTFVLDDGTRQLTFEFDSILDGNVTAGNVAVPFDASDADPAPVARAIRDAINSPQSQNELSIVASTGDLRDAGESTGNLVELFGSSISVNPGGGRFIKVDLVAEETFQGRESSQTIPVVDHDAQTVEVRGSVNNTARAAVSGYADGSTDVLVAVGKIGDYVVTGEITDDDPRLFFLDPEQDSDAVRIYLQAGATIDIDVDSAGFARGAEVLDLPVITVFNNDVGPDGRATRAAQSSLNVASAAPGEFDTGAFLEFTAPASGYYNVAVSSANLYGTSTLTAIAVPAAAYDGTNFTIVSRGFQETFQFTIDPSLVDPDNLILLDAADTDVDIAAKAAAVIASVFPNSLEPTSEGAIINLGDVDSADAFRTISATVNTGSSFLFLSIREADFGEYALTIRPQASSSAAIPDRDVVAVDYQFGIGDENRVRDQGQIIIASNFISDSAGFGIVATAGPRGQGFASNGNVIRADDTPRPGSARLLRNENSNALIPGAVITNNVVSNSGGGGILFAGGSAANGESPAPVPFGRIVNNTIVGNGAGSGIVVRSAASPTLLNNIVAGFATGLDVDGSSQAAGTIVGGNAYQDNQTDSTLPLATSSFVIPSSTQLFEDAARGLYIPADGSRVIDSSFGSLPDRLDFFNTVKQPVGISPSPIIAPELDAYGQTRVNDFNVPTPGGVGLNPNIDRGAIDRADANRPVAVLTGPQDAIGAPIPGGDGDTDESFVRLSEGTVEFFEVQLLDASGTGPDATTITPETVLLTENGQRLIAGVDYVFGYSDNSRTIRLTPLAGLWRPDAVYEITLNNRQRISLELDRGDEINDGDQIIISDQAGGQSVFEFESGFSAQVPQTSLLTVRGTNADFQDRDTFTITAPDGTVRTFEVNVSGSSASGSVPLELTTAGTVQEVRQAILNALNSFDAATGMTVAAALDIVPVAVGNSQIQLGTLAGHGIAGVVNGLDFSGQPGGVTDGETLTYTAGTESVTFEFTTTSLDPSNPNTPISFTRSDTPDQIAESVAAALAAANLGVANAQAIGSGRVLLGGAIGDQLDLSLSSLLLQGVPGVAGSLTLTVPAAADGASLDNTTFVIDVDGNSETFRYTTDPALSSPDRLILVGAADDADMIATATAAEISQAFPSKLSPLVINEVITLGEQSAIPPAGVARSIASVNPGTSGLILDGVSGGAIAVPFLPTAQFTESATAATLQAAIRSAPLAVETFSPGGGTLLIAGASSIVGIDAGGLPVTIGTTLPAIADLAGNPVRETRINDETRFTIIMPEVVFDLGDAPASYGTRFADNGARHAVGGDRQLRLGRFLDTELDGQPSPLSDDTPLAVSVSGSILFAIDSSVSSTIRVTVRNRPPQGETLVVDVAGTLTTFELIDVATNPQIGNVPVIVTALDGPAEIAAKILTTIRGTIEETSDALLLSVDPNDASTFVFEAVDDEDGVSVGVFSAPGGQNLLVFTTPGTDPNNVAGSQVLGYINPLDPAGTNLAVTVTGAGLLDMWVDFDRNGFFESDEQMLANTPVVDGVNVLTMFAPSDASFGDTWMRFRVSSSGDLGPTGVAVGGEVEDYPISVLPIALPLPVDDSYTAIEDTPLDVVVGNPQGVLLDNDLGIPSQILPVRYFVGVPPANGTITVIDEFTGEFTYTPAPDFYGQDTFTYRLSTQQNTSPSSIASSTFATVTITVAPVNDNPGVDDAALRTIEDIQEEDLFNGGLVIQASVLLASAVPDADPMTSLDPQDENNQQIFVQSITTVVGGNTTVLDASNPAAELETIRGGTISAVFDIDGNITSLLYKPAKDFNSENLPATIGDFLDDEFVFTVVDDGVTLPADGAPPLSPAPETASATAFIRVTPQNDPPEPAADDVSVTDPSGAYIAYYTNLGEPVPVPTEDRQLVIPSEFLLQNDQQGPLLTADERSEFNGNDGPMRVVSVGLVDPSMGKSITVDLLTGDITFVPEDDIFGEVQFTYTVEDAGIDQAAALDSMGNPAPKLAAPLQTTITSRIFLEPINDLPVAVDRLFDVTEAVESRPPDAPVSPAQITISRDALLAGSAADLLNPTINATASDITLVAPYNEDIQILEVNSVTVGGVTTSVTSTLVTASGGELAVEFDSNGFLIQAVYSPPLDFNSTTPFFVPEDTFTYTIIDNGVHEFPVGNALSPNTPSETSAEATVTLTVTPANDLPVFDIPSEVDILERDDMLATRVNGFVTNVAGGPQGTALDEQPPSQTVSFTVSLLSSTSPTLMTRDPDLSSGSFIEFFPAPDEFGTSVYLVTGTDDGTPNRAFSQSFTVNVRPVNDAPRFDPTVAGTSDRRDADTAYSVANGDFDGDGQIDDATITYTLREDNTQASGGTSTPYFMPLTSGPLALGYQQLGLLDVFTVGPANESAPLPGGSQQLELFSFGNPPSGGSPDFTTALGGTLRSVFSSSVLIGLEYTPPQDFNNLIGGFDSFTYQVRDDSTTGGETFDLAGGALVPDRLISTNRVLLNLNPVNDRPVFTVSTTNIEVPEDSNPLDFPGFAFNINPGPPTTAFDEIDIFTGQRVDFTVTSLDFPQADAADFFTQFPAVNKDDGLLTFQAAPNVFGEFNFEIFLVDDGPGTVDGASPRGDLITSLPVTLTINVQPTNDAPVINPDVPPLQFTLLEDGTVDVLVTGDNTSPGLLDLFLPGPANESEDILPMPGGNQSLSLGNPVPVASTEGGLIEAITDSLSGEITRLIYHPRKDFVGRDSFIFTVIDDGVSVNIGTGGVPFSDPRIASNTVTFEVLPVNDAPLFSGAADVVSDEDQGVVVIDAWANNVQAGPITAIDELDGNSVVSPQTREFVFTQLSSNTGLFSSPPTATIDGDTASLVYESAPDANGVAVFEAVLRDSGPQDASIGDVFVSVPTTFTISVNAVNDPPTFTPAADITVAEDSGPYNEQWASGISPGPADESGQSVQFIVTTPPEFASLFQSEPVISDAGVLRFTPATDANTDNVDGPAQIQVTAIDSDGGQAQTVTLLITISEVNDVPMANPDAIDTDEDTVLTITSAQLLANDFDPDLISNVGETLTIVMPPQSLSVSGAVVLFDAVSGDITYDPLDANSIQSLAPGETLVDSFSYSVIDAAGASSNRVTVGLTVAGLNDAPIVVDDDVDLNPDGVTIIRPLDNDTDLDGTIDSSSIIVTLQPAFGSLAISADGTLTYTPFVAFSEEDQFRYSVADNLGQRSGQATVTISANARPVALDDARGTFLDEAVDINVAANDFDPDGTLDLGSIVIVTQPVSGEAIPQGGGIVRYLPNPGFLGRDSFQYQILDNEGRASNVAIVETQVVASRLQNPDVIYDVNNDGFVTALDALLVINELARADGVGSIPVLPTDVGPDFYDVNGNQFITTNDALLVINEISRQNAGEAGFAGEQIAQPTRSGTDLAASSTADMDPAIVSDALKVVGTSLFEGVSADVVDLIAEDRENGDDQDKAIAAFDAAMADLL